MNNSAMKSRVNIALTTSCRTVRNRAAVREMFANRIAPSAISLANISYAPLTDLSPGIFWAFRRCGWAGRTMRRRRRRRRSTGGAHRASVQSGGSHAFATALAHLLQDVNHLTTQVQDQQRHPQRRHLNGSQPRSALSASSALHPAPSRAAAARSVCVSSTGAWLTTPNTLSCFDGEPSRKSEIVTPLQL